MRPKTEEFMRANDESPVVAGRAIGDGGKGAVYTLDNGKRFTLGLLRRAASFLTAIRDGGYDAARDNDGGPIHRHS
jgi:hypothetical protein